MDHFGILLAIGACVAAAQLWVSIRLFRSQDYSGFQKGAQTAIIWLLPVIGAIVVYSLMSTDGKPPRVAKSSFPEDGDIPDFGGDH